MMVRHTVKVEFDVEALEKLRPEGIPDHAKLNQWASHDITQGQRDPKFTGLVLVWEWDDPVEVIVDDE